MHGSVSPFNGRQWTSKTGVIGRGGNAGMPYTVVQCPCGWTHRRNGRDDAAQRAAWQEALELHPVCKPEEQA